MTRNAMRWGAGVRGELAQDSAVKMWRFRSGLAPYVRNIWHQNVATTVTRFGTRSCPAAC